MKPDSGNQSASDERLDRTARPRVGARERERVEEEPLHHVVLAL